jgi:hypothetical protein
MLNTGHSYGPIEDTMEIIKVSNNGLNRKMSLCNSIKRHSYT